VEQAVAVDFDDPTPSIDNPTEVAPHFRLAKQEALAVLSEVGDAFSRLGRRRLRRALTE
jgi:hypothetical protein